MNSHGDASQPGSRDGNPPGPARSGRMPASPFGSAASRPGGTPPSKAEMESWREPRYVHGFTQADYQQFYGLNHWPDFPPPPRE